WHHVRPGPEVVPGALEARHGLVGEPGVQSGPRDQLEIRPVAPDGRGDLEVTLAPRSAEFRPPERRRDAVPDRPAVEQRREEVEAHCAHAHGQPPRGAQILTDTPSPEA